MARLQIFLAALWWGSITTVGFMVVPMLFIEFGNTRHRGTDGWQIISALTWLASGLRRSAVVGSQAPKLKPNPRTFALGRVSGMVVGFVD